MQITSLYRDARKCIRVDHLFELKQRSQVVGLDGLDSQRKRTEDHLFR